MTYIDIFQNHFKIILPEFFFISAILIILIYGTLYNASVYYKYPILTYSIGYLSIQSLLITLWLTINAQQCWASSVVIFNNVLIMDDFTLFVKTIVLLGSLATIFISFNYILNQKMSARINEYMVLILFSTLSMLLVISSFDLISMYLAIELQSLSFYVLAAFQRNNEFSTEAGLKYFILGALASGLLLFGESLIYGFTGLTNFEELTKLISVLPETANSQTLSSSSSAIITWLAWFPFFSYNFTYIQIVTIGLFFIIIAFLFKISAVPFHLWTPDVYEGAPTSVTAFFSITPKIAVLALLLRLCMYTFYDLIDSWQFLIIFSSFLSMLIGTLGAIHQNKIKRLFAYSSIAHVGYLLISLGTGTIESIEALLIYAVLYTLTILNVFSIILVMSKENFNIHESKDDNLVASQLAELPKIHYQPTILHLRNITETYPLNDFLNFKNRQLKSSIGGDGKEAGVKKSEEEEAQNTSSKLGLTLQISSSKIKLFEKSYNSFKLRWTSLAQGNPIWDPYHALKQTTFPSSYILRGDESPEEYLKKQDIKTLSINDTRIITHFKTSNIMLGNQLRLPYFRGPKEKKTKYIKHITDFSTLAKTNPILALTAAIIFFSNAGIPPLAGFYGKLNVFLTAVENSMYFLALSGILCSVIGTFYSIRLVKIIYYHNMSEKKWNFYQPISKENAIILALTFFFTLFFFLSPSFLFITAHSAALSLCI